MIDFRNPQWGDEARSFINMEIRLDREVREYWAGMHDCWVPFSASMLDNEDYGRWLFEQASAGPVAEFTPPSAEQTRASMRPLTPREFRDALIDNDIMPDQVTAAIGQIADPKTRAKALNAWEYPTQFTRTDPLVDQIGTIFGLTPEAIDKLWTEAS